MSKNKDNNIINSLNERIRELENRLENIANSVRDEYLHSKDWMKNALEKLVYFAAIELQPATIDVFHNKVITFLGDSFFNYKYSGFFTYSEKQMKWEMLSEKGTCPFETLSMPEFKGSMVIEEDYEIYQFFDISDKSYLIHVSLIGSDKKFSEHDFSFISLFVVLITSFLSIKILDREVQDKMIENTNMRNNTRIIKSLKENTMTLEDAFIEIIQNLNVEAFVIARKPRDTDDLKIVLSDGINARNWDSFMHTILENEDYAGEEWLVLPLIDDALSVYGMSAFRLSTNLSIKNVQEKTLDYLIPQFAEILSNRKLQKDAITDELTGAYNRRYVMKILEDRFKRTTGSPESKLSVAMLDIDNFKSVNDNFGHLAGDAVLKGLVEVLNKTLREVDVVGRYGGEEFIIIVSAKHNVTLKVCERIRSAVENMKIEWDNKEFWITVSIGFVSYSNNIPSVEEMIALADISLYEAKKKGKNRVVEYDINKG